MNHLAVSVCAKEAMQQIANNNFFMPKTVQFFADLGQSQKPEDINLYKEILTYFIRTSPSANTMFKADAKHVFVPRFALPKAFQQPEFSKEEMDSINSGGADIKA